MYTYASSYYISIVDVIESKSKRKIHNHQKLGGYLIAVTANLDKTSL